MASHLQRLQFKGLPEWFRKRGYDRLPKDGRFQSTEITGSFIKDYHQLDLVGQRNVFVYAEDQADEKLLLLLYQGGKKAAFNPRDILLPNEKVISQGVLNLYLASAETDPVIGHSLLPEIFGSEEKAQLLTTARLIFGLGDSHLPRLLAEHGSLLFIGLPDGEPERGVSCATVAHERAHVTLNRWNDPEGQQFKAKAAEELKNAKAKLEELFAEIEAGNAVASGAVAGNGIRVTPEIYRDEGHLESLHPLAYLYGYEVGGVARQNFSDWFKQHQMVNTQRLYEMLFERTILADPEVAYNYEHRLWPKEEWVVDAVIAEWMGKQSTQALEEILVHLISFYRPGQGGDAIIHGRIWRYLERQVLDHTRQRRFLSKERCDCLRNVFRTILFTRDQNPKLARQVFSSMTSHPTFFPPRIIQYSFFAPPKFSPEGKALSPGFFIHEYHDLASRVTLVGRKIVVLHWDQEGLPPKKLQALEGTPPYNSEGTWSWSELRPADADETQETLEHLWNWQFNRTSLQSSRRENRAGFWWSAVGASSGLFFGLLGGALLWQEGEPELLPLGITSAGAALGSYGGYKVWQARQDAKALNVLESVQQRFYPVLNPIANLDAAKRFDTSRSHPFLIQRPGK